MRDDLRYWLDIMREAGPRAILADLVALFAFLFATLAVVVIVDALLHG